MAIKFKVIEKGQPGVKGGGEKKFYASANITGEKTLAGLHATSKNQYRKWCRYSCGAVCSGGCNGRRLSRRAGGSSRRARKPACKREQQRGSNSRRGKCSEH